VPAANAYQARREGGTAAKTGPANRMTDMIEMALSL